MLAVAKACGVRNVSADVTFDQLTLRHRPGADAPDVIRGRRIGRRQADYGALTDVDQNVTDLAEGRIDADRASSRISALVQAGARSPEWMVTLGWAVTGTGIALTLGGTPLVCLLALLAAAAVHGTQRLVAPLRLPSFYVQAAGGLVATSIAVLAALTSLEVDPSRVVTVGIVVLLAGVGILGATQDAMTGYPLTACARMVDSLLDTSGIVTGVAAGLTLGQVLGVDLAAFTPVATDLPTAGVAVVGASVAAAGFAFASYGPMRSLLAVGIVAALGQVVALAVGEAQLGRAWGPACAAVTIGAVCHLASGLFRVPPLVVVVPAIVPLLPGLDVYQGLALLAQGQDGVLQLALALGTAIALSAGVILGQQLVRPLRSRAYRLESRFAGPRTPVGDRERPFTPDG